MLSSKQTHKISSPSPLQKFMNQMRSIRRRVCPLLSTFLAVGVLATLLLPGVSAQESTTTFAKPKVIKETALKVDKTNPYDALALEAAPYLKFNQLIKSVIRTCQPSVVHIEAQKSVQKGNGALTRIEEAGAGVIIRHRGKLYVVTNRHVIAKAKVSDILIQAHDGRFFRPTDVRTDRDTDLAVLFTSATQFESSRIGDSEKAQLATLLWPLEAPLD